MQGQGAHRLTRRGRLGAELGATDQDLTVRAFELAARRVGLTAHYHFIQESDIPTSRGMGSSGAAIAAGLLLARAASMDALSMEDLLCIGTEMEGHPDNVVASLLGGLTICQARPTNPSLTLFQVQVHSSIGFAVVWPGKTLATKDSRSVLPDRVSRADAVSNAGNLAFLLEGLRSGSKELIQAGERDSLHVPFRLPLIRGSEATLAAARQAGAWLATISGSGSSLIALGPSKEMPPILEAMRTCLGTEQEAVEGQILTPVYGTPQVER